MRSIVNLIIFDPSRQVFDASLISARAKPKQALIKFYNGKNRNGIPRNLASTELTSLETAEAWFEVVSNLQDVAYCRSVIENDKDYYYELEPTDMLQAVARLFGNEGMKVNFSITYNFFLRFSIVKCYLIHSTCSTAVKYSCANQGQ